MPPKTLEFLGTGTSQGVPVIGCTCTVCTSSDSRDRRLRSSALIRTPRAQVAIDCGPDFRQQMLRAGVQHLDAVFLTHEHMDHVSGLDDLRALQFLQKEPTRIYCTERVEARLKQQFAYAFSEKPYPGAPKFEIHRLTPGVSFDFQGDRWLPLEVMHGTLPILAFQIESLVYITDASSIPLATWNEIKGADTFVLNALRREPHYSHFNLEQALETAHSLEAKHTWLTHISHHLGTHALVSSELPDHVHLAYDTLVLNSLG